MMHRLTLAIALTCVGVAMAPSYAQNAPAVTDAHQAQTPEQVVQGIVKQLDTVFSGQNPQQLAKHRDKLIQTINDVLLPHFDVDYAAILVLGQHAREATPEQRQSFAKAFYASLTHKYAEGLLRYTQGRVKVLPVQGDLSDKRSIVRTQVLADDGKTIAVDYAFRKGQVGDWKAYDVIIEGISYVTNYRNQVDLEIKKSGLDKLISTLETNGDKALNSIENNGKASP